MNTTIHLQEPGIEETISVQREVRVRAEYGPPERLCHVTAVVIKGIKDVSPRLCVPSIDGFSLAGWEAFKLAAAHAFLVYENKFGAFP